jgi:hypothetical protein
MEDTLKYSDIEYNPMVVDWGDKMWDKYPYLQKFPLLCSVVPEVSDVHSELVVDEILRYVILFVDEFSPFRKERDFDFRKQQIFEVIEDFSPAAKDNINKNGDTFQQIMYHYFVISNGVEFETWLSLKMALHEGNEYLRMPQNSSADPEKVMGVKKGIKQTISEDLKRLKEMEKSLFPDKLTKRIIAREQSEKSLSNYAEKYATPIPEMQ